MNKLYRAKLKSLLGFIIYRTGLHKLVFRDKAVIVLFHRINDALKGNPISMATEEFKAFCDFFRKHFEVITLTELLVRLENGEDLSHCAVITFDDGYKDNLTVAANELKKRNLPACFFISTDFIGSTKIPKWDEKRGIKTEWMNWDDVRSLRIDGFEVGSHTVNHVDLGLVAGEKAIREITDSKRRLENELKTEIEHFSYPFGGKNQITETNREVVGKTGYRSCVSAYGGTVTSGCDPFDLPRLPISSWYSSPYQFGFEVIFNRS